METQSSKGKEVKIPGPDHPITISPAEGKVRVTVAGRIVAESTQALRLEKGYPPVYYRDRLRTFTYQPSKHTPGAEHAKDNTRTEQGDRSRSLRYSLQ